MSEVFAVVVVSEVSEVFVVSEAFEVFEVFEVHRYDGAPVALLLSPMRVDDESHRK